MQIAGAESDEGGRGWSMGKRMRSLRTALIVAAETVGWLAAGAVLTAALWVLLVIGVFLWVLAFDDTSPPQPTVMNSLAAGTYFVVAGLGWLAAIISAILLLNLQRCRLWPYAAINAGIVAAALSALGVFSLVVVRQAG